MDAGSASRLRTAAAFLAISASLVAFTSLEFMLEAVQDEFSLSSEETIVVAQIPAGACLLVVFLAGALADRFGDRRLLGAACGTFAVGALLAGLAPHAGFLLLGLSIGGVGTIGMSIVGLSILAKNFPDPGHRARAFGLFAVIAPAVAIAVPLASSALVTGLGWRWVTTTWIGLAGVTWSLARRTLPRRPDDRGRPELVTPALAGVALSGIALAFLFVGESGSNGGLAPLIIGSAVVGVAAIVVLFPVMARHAEPTLDLRALRVRGALPVAVAVFAINAVNLFLFTYLLLQYRFHQSLLETALLLIPPQLTAMVGAVVGGRLSARFGSRHVAAVSLALAAVLSLTTLLVTVDSSPWVPVLALTLVALPIAAAVGAITHVFMDLAPADGEGATSAVRNAVVNLGIATGGVVIGTIIFDEIDANTSRTLAAYTAQVDAFHLAGLVSFAVYLVAAAMVVAHLRRRSDTSRRVPLPDDSGMHRR